MIQRTLMLLLFPTFLGFSTTSIQAQISVVNLRGINTAFQEYAPTFYQNGLIFIASNPAVNKDKKEDAQIGKSTTSIFYAKRGKDGSLQRPILFSDELTTKFYDGPLSFNAAGDVVYFTRTNVRKGKLKVGRDGKIKLKIYTAKLNTSKGIWENIEELPFNSNDFDCMHPSVSADGQRLFFSSNRPGGKGGLDLYVSYLQKGKWGNPVNLGDTINTAKNEIFPFIHPDNTLYFASNGRKAVGGIDIFWTVKTQNGWFIPNAMPEPINSPSDDFGIIITEDKKSGFFSSNRASGEGDDDIFSFMDDRKPIIVNSKGLRFINDTIPQPFEAVRTNAWKEDKHDRENNFEEPKYETVESPPIALPYNFEMRNIYYGEGDAEVNEEAKIELAPLLKMMLKDPKIEIEIASHTDSKGKATFNMSLSQLRADNIKTYFIANRVAPDRIRAFGYGETMIRNRCKRGVDCTDEEHAQNQRTLIKIVQGLDPWTIVDTEKPKKPATQPAKVNNTVRIDTNTEGGHLIAGNAYPTQDVTSATPAAKKRYYVIIGTYAKPENAQKQQKKATEAGFIETKVVQYQDNQLYGVSVSLMSDRNEARKLAEYINSQKIFEAFVKEMK